MIPLLRVKSARTRHCNSPERPFNMRTQTLSISKVRTLGSRLNGLVVALLDVVIKSRQEGEG